MAKIYIMNMGFVCDQGEGLTKHLCENGINFA